MATLETCYPNVYYGLLLAKYGVPIWETLGQWRQGMLPKMEVWQATGSPAGIVATPPPFHLIKYGPSLPTQKGKAHICMVEIRKQ